MQRDPQQLEEQAQNLLKRYFPNEKFEVTLIGKGMPLRGTRPLNEAFPIKQEAPEGELVKYTAEELAKMEAKYVVRPLKQQEGLNRRVGRNGNEMKFGVFRQMAGMEVLESRHADQAAAMVARRSHEEHEKQKTPVK
jgi:hypothetical protein